MRSRSPAARVHYDGTSRDDESNQRQQDRVRLTESQPRPVPPGYILTGLRDIAHAEISTTVVLVEVAFERLLYPRCGAPSDALSCSV